MKTISIYTDGSAVNRIPLPERVGGFGALILSEGNDLTLSGALLGITSQQAEMMAVIVSLNYLRENGYKDFRVEVFSDSAYIVNCFRDKWYENWEITGWFNIKNEEYWKVLLMLVFECQLNLRFNWIKGHSGIDQNERVDKIARNARNKLEECLRRKIT